MILHYIYIITATLALLIAFISYLYYLMGTGQDKVGEEFDRVEEEMRLKEINKLKHENNTINIQKAE